MCPEFNQILWLEFCSVTFNNFCTQEDFLEVSDAVIEILEDFGIKTKSSVLEKKDECDFL